MSERKEAKERQRQGVKGFNGENVFAVFSKPNAMNDPEQTYYVAGYMRVSTDTVEQVSSIELQQMKFMKVIEEKSNWVDAGIYCDEGRSGTNTKHRPAFNLLMQHAMEGGIDIIYTRSVSRFARNLNDCLKWVEKLKKHDPPVAVYFEAEGFNSLDSRSGLILTVMAMVAEEESHMKSETMLSSLETRFMVGRFLLPKLLGYDSIKDDKGVRNLFVNDDEAKTIKLMYFLLLNGEDPGSIAETLMDLKRPTGLGRFKWTASTVRAVMANERYCGDVLARKTWTPDFHDHISVPNKGGKNRYYHSAHHEAIVTRAQWNAAQKILNGYTYGYRGPYYFTKVICEGALTGYISIHPRWGGYEAADLEEICEVVMEGGMYFENLEEKVLPDAGHPLELVENKNGLFRSSRYLTEEEQNFLALKEGKEPAEEEEQKGFQVIGSDFFSSGREPSIRFTYEYFFINKYLFDKLPMHYELLFHPEVKYLCIRPCEGSLPEAIAREKQTVKCGFEKVLYEIMGWKSTDEYTIAPVRRGDCFFFDMNKNIGKKEDAEKENTKRRRANRLAKDDNYVGFFIPPNGQEPMQIEEKKRIPKNFGKHPHAIKSVACFPEKDLMVEAKAINGSDCKIDDELLLTLWEELEADKEKWAIVEALQLEEEKQKKGRRKKDEDEEEDF